MSSKSEITEPVDLVRRQVERIVSSDGFRRAEKLTRMLRFLVEETLAGRGSELKEITVGIGVFDRSADFRPEEDNIVRVQARNLRTKLEIFYKTSGSADELLVAVERGSYTPVFRRREIVTEKPQQRMTIAVLPFANLTGDSGFEYFSDGLTEEIIGGLSRIAGLLVVARTSVFAFKGIYPDIREVAARLGVKFLLEGTVRRAVDRVRVTARLVEASRGFEQWSETYDQALDASMDVQRKIASAIAIELRMLDQRPVIQPPQRFGFHVYELYLKARHHWQLRTEADANEAIQQLELAIKIDPCFAPAYSGLADCYTLAAIYGRFPGDMILPRAKQLATDAVKLDPSSVQALTALGMIASVFDWDHESAKVLYQKAIELQPSYPDARQWYANLYLSTFGRFDEAIEQLEEALRSDPLSLVILGDLGNTLSLAGRHLDGIQACEQALARSPQFFRPHWQIGLIYERLGRYEEAIAAFRRCRALCASDIFESDAVGSLGHALALAGRGDDAHRCLSDLEMLSAGKVPNRISFALVHLGLRNIDATFDWLNRAADVKAGSVIWLGTDPRARVLRDDPRFRKLLHDMKLVC